MEAHSDLFLASPLATLNRFFEELTTPNDQQPLRISPILTQLPGQCTGLYMTVAATTADARHLSIPAPTEPTNGLLLFLWIGSEPLRLSSGNQHIDPIDSGLLVLQSSAACQLELPPAYRGQWLFLHLTAAWQQAYLATLDETMFSQCSLLPLPDYYQTKLMALPAIGAPPTASLQFAARLNEVFFDVVTLLDRSVKGQSTTNAEELTTWRVQQLLTNALYQPFPSLQTLAEGCNVSVSTLKKHFQRVTSTTLEQYFLQTKMQLATELMAQGFSVKEVANRLGYTSPANFSHAFKRCYGVSPREYRRIR